MASSTPELASHNDPTWHARPRCSNSRRAPRSESGRSGGHKGSPLEGGEDPHGVIAEVRAKLGFGEDPVVDDGHAVNAGAEHGSLDGGQAGQVHARGAGGRASEP